MINANKIMVTDDETVIEALWKNEDCILLERHVDSKTGLPVSEEWIVPNSFRVSREGLKVGQKTA